MRIILFFSLFLLSQSLFAKDIFEQIDPDTHTSDFSGDFKESIWKEEYTQLPDLPDEHNLIVFSGVSAYPQYRYAIDEKTLSVGKKDAVVRFIVVIRSSSGTASSYYQGLNCHSKQIKTYAYAHSSAKQFTAYSAPVWDNLSDNGAMGYSKGLAEFYFCDLLGGVLKQQAILNNLKYENDAGGVYYD
jgi:CNP1-like family